MQHFILPKLAGVLGHILVRQRCVVCNEDSGSVPLCPKCYRERLLDYTPFYIRDSEGALVPNKERCKVCSRVLLVRIGLCTRCRALSASGAKDAAESLEPRVCEGFKGLYLVLHYSLWVKSLVYEWKIAGKRLLTYNILGLLVKVMADIPNIANLPIVPVPPRLGKLKEKGWDQIDFLCHMLKRLGYKIAPLLGRTTSQEQKHLSSIERFAMAQSSYTPCKSYLSNLRRHKPYTVPEAVVLLDDVYTTGATLRACARVLKSMGVQEVYGIAMFYV